MVVENRLIFHDDPQENMAEVINTIAQRIKQEGDKPYVTVERQLELLYQLSEFKLGAFLLQNRALDGFWTHYVVTYPWRKQKYTAYELKPLEKFLLERAPTALATQQRFNFFLEENQQCVENGKSLAAIPSGLMSELLYLNYDGIKNIELFGIDHDSETLEKAEAMAKKFGLAHYAKFIQSDAWLLEFQNKFDLISSNGLNIYEPDDEKVTKLYKGFYRALKSKGKLVTSFLTFPPHFTDKSEWNVGKINQEDLLLQKIIFVDIIGGKWQCFRTLEQTRQQLESVGFSDIRFISDEANQFPTVIAIKK